MLAHERGTNRTRSAVSAGSKSIESLEKAPGVAGARPLLRKPPGRERRQAASLRHGEAIRGLSTKARKERRWPDKNAGHLAWPRLWLSRGWSGAHCPSACQHSADEDEAKPEHGQPAGRYVGRSRCYAGGHHWIERSEWPASATRPGSPTPCRPRTPSTSPSSSASRRGSSPRALPVPRSRGCIESKEATRGRCSH